MSEDPFVDIRPEDLRLLERRYARTHALLRIYRWALAAALVVIGVLTLLLFVAKSPSFGRVILVDGKPVAMVRNAKAAAAVRQRLLATAGGPAEGATLKESWEDASRPADGERILSVGEAFRLLRDKVTVLKEAFAIEDAGTRLVVVPSRDMAQSVLDHLKAKYASPADAVVRMTRLRPAPMIRPCTALPAKIITDEQQAMSQLINARVERVYTIQAGDFPEKVASSRGMTVAEFWGLNPTLHGQTLHPGQQVTVLEKHGGLTVVTIKETVSTETVAPPVRKQTTVTLPRGEKKITDAGSPGRKRVRWEITMNNDREVARRPLSEEIIVEARPQVVLLGTK